MFLTFCLFKSFFTFHFLYLSSIPVQDAARSSDLRQVPVVGQRKFRGLHGQVRNVANCQIEENILRKNYAITPVFQESNAKYELGIGWI